MFCKPRTPPHVLVVDDDPLVQLAVGKLLEKLGCQVSKALNGKLGAEMVCTQSSTLSHFDLILMDVNMPVMNGYESARLINEQTSGLVPIVCFSAQDSAEHRSCCREAGMHHIRMQRFVLR